MTNAQALETIRSLNSKQGKENRANGLQFEFKVLAELKKNSILALRSAGSHTLVDLMAIKNKKTWLISAKKNGYLNPKEREEIENIKTHLPKDSIMKLAYAIGNKIKFKNI